MATTLELLSLETLTDLMGRVEQSSERVAVTHGGRRAALVPIEDLDRLRRLEEEDAHDLALVEARRAEGGERISLAEAIRLLDL